MTLDEFLDIREKKKVTGHEVKRILGMCGYPSELIATHCVNLIDKDNQPYKKAVCTAELEGLKLPHFSYIKFYCEKSYKCEGSEEDILKHIYALVAGKTNTPGQDISFRLPEKNPPKIRGDKAKRWIEEQREIFRWCHKKVLIVWTPELICESPTTEESKRLSSVAVALEGKLRQLFGLFNS